MFEVTDDAIRDLLSAPALTSRRLEIVNSAEVGPCVSVSWVSSFATGLQHYFYHSQVISSDVFTDGSTSMGTNMDHLSLNFLKVVKHELQD